MAKRILEFKNISKDYGGQSVLKNISFSVHAGEIHALLGENGAGKSTLMNILFGMPVIHSTGGYSGEILFEGKREEIQSASDSIKLGIGMVHQEFMLLPKFTVAENIKLNREITRPNLLSRILGKKGRSIETLDIRKMEEEAKMDLDRLNIEVLKENMLVDQLPVGFMQFVEIAREIDKENMKLLIFDEPTAVLTEEESQIFLQAVKKIAREGIAVIFISHKLDEIIQVADNITILKDGGQVCTIPSVETNVLQLAELMVGRKFERIIPVNEGREHGNKKSVALEIKNLQVDMPGERVKGLDLTVYEGEILGIASLAGQGKIGIANGIMGLSPGKGEITLFGKPFLLNSPTEALKRGLAFVSEDRKGMGLLLDKSIEMNLIIAVMQIKGEFLKKIWIFNQLDRKAIRKNALLMIKELDIRCNKGPEQKTGRLSGGNQQKVCLGRALAMNPKVLFVSEPTRGIDIGAKRMILDMLAQLNRETGLTIIITSSELAELRSVSSRIAVIFDGRLEGILNPDDSDISFGLTISGRNKEILDVKEKGGEC